MENLIELVRMEPVLYDTRHQDYKKISLKEEIWERIAGETNMTDGSSARDVWLKLRNTHRDALRRKRKLRSTSTSVVIKPWKYEKEMQFLMPFMDNRYADPFENLSQQSENIDIEITPKIVKSEFISIENNFFDENARILDPPNSTQKLDEDCNINEFEDVFTLALPAKKIKRTTKNTNVHEYTQTNHLECAREKVLRIMNKPAETDELYHFFMSIYGLVKTMPKINQIKMKRVMFNAVTDEDELILTNNGTETAKSKSPGSLNESINEPLASPNNYNMDESFVDT